MSSVEFGKTTEITQQKHVRGMPLTNTPRPQNNHKIGVLHIATYATTK